MAWFILGFMLFWFVMTAVGSFGIMCRHAKDEDRRKTNWMNFNGKD